MKSGLRQKGTYVQHICAQQILKKAETTEAALKNCRLLCCFMQFSSTKHIPNVCYDVVGVMV